MVVIKPIRNEETEERRQSQTVIVLDTQETDGVNNQMAKTQIIFLFHRQGATSSNQTNRKLFTQSH